VGSLKPIRTSPKIGLPIRLDFKSTRDVAAEGDAARRLDQTGGRLQPFKAQLERVPADKHAGRTGDLIAGIESGYRAL